MTNERKDKRLDDDTYDLFEKWKRANLNSYAPASHHQVIQDFEEILIDARQRGLSPDEAMKQLPRSWVTWFGLHTKYLLYRDVVYIQRCTSAHNWISTPISLPFFGVISGVSLMALGIVMLVSSPATLPAAVLFFILGIFPLEYGGLSLARRWAIDAMGPMGVAVTSSSVVTIVNSGLLVGIWAMSNLTVLAPFGLGALALLYGISFFGALPQYACFILRVQRNHELVGALLGLPGYEAELEESPEA